MPDMPEWISKGPILKRLDEKSLVRGNLEALLAALRNEMRSLPDIALQLLGVTQSEADHLERDWFDDDTRWWKDDIANPGPIIRAGLIGAVEFALQPSKTGLCVDGTGDCATLTPLPGGHLPLDTYWVCQRGGNKREVSLAFGWSPRQVTVMVHTPHPPDLGGDLSVFEPIRLVQLAGGVPADPLPIMHRPSL